MIKNINENNKKPNINYYLNINFKKRNIVMIVEFETVVSELKQKIYSYFKIEPERYDLYYKNIKINSNDNRPIALLFQKEIERNPLLFIVDKKINKSSSAIMPIYSANINTTIPPKKFSQILNKFFEYKNCPNDAIIKNNIKGIYEVKFRKSIFPEEFIQFFNINYNNKLKLNLEKIILPPIDQPAGNEENNKKKLLMNKRSNSITYKNENENINKKLNNDNGVIPFKYINSDEKYFNDKIIDTKNWLYKKGFINNTGKYNINNNYIFIENYVGATPNIPPVLHRFRDVSKNQWINERGFYP
jgi:hypothetical protein